MYVKRNPDNPKYYMIYYRYKDENGKQHNIVKKNTKDPKRKNKKYVLSLVNGVIKEKKEKYETSKQNEDISFQKLVSSFCNYSKSQKSTDTIKHYISDSKIYLYKFFDKTENIENIFVPRKINDFITYLSHQEIKLAKANKLVSLMRLITEYAFKRDYISADIYLKCKSNLVAIHHTEISDLENLNRDPKNKYTPFKDFYAAYITDNETPQYDKDMLYLLYFSGCRIGEFLGITIDRIQFIDEKATIIIDQQVAKNGVLISTLKNKNSKRTIVLTKEGTKILLQYMKSKYLKQEDKGRLFRYSRRTLERILKRFLKRNNLPMNTVHGFGRKSINEELYLNNVDDKGRMSYLGQKTVQVNYDSYIDKSKSLSAVSKALEKIEEENKKDVKND